MEPDRSAPDSRTPSEQTQSRFAWAQLQTIVLDSQETSTGFVVDLPADRYEDVIDLVERELDLCGGWLSLTVERKQELILLTASTDDLEGQSLIREMVGLEDEA